MVFNIANKQSLLPAYLRQEAFFVNAVGRYFKTADLSDSLRCAYVVL